MKYQVIGLMSGSSCDGLDLAYCHFNEVNNGWSFDLIEARTFSYEEELLKKLQKVSELNAESIAKLDVELGRLYGKLTNQFIVEHRLKVDFICSHGHTVFHQPEHGFSLQIGAANHIHAACSLPVIADFRSMDIAFGGQGAPLVPIGDKLLFADNDICINIGGIANLSYELNGKRLAYDVCAANMVLNSLADQLGLRMDKDGKHAGEGEMIANWFEYLQHLPYYEQEGPKTMGIEWCKKNILDHMPDAYINDLLHTYTHHIAAQLAENIHQISVKTNNKKPSVLITGGGAHNTYLIECITKKLAPDVSLNIPSTEIINFKEAIIFGFLGVLKMNSIPNCLASVTGATKDVCGGVLFN